MDYLSDISEALHHLKNAQDSLHNIHIKYSDNQAMLNLYEPSIKYLVECLHQDLSELIDEYVGSCNYEPDVWVHIQGSVFKDGSAPLSLVSSFIKKLVTANQHAVTLLKDVAFSGIRINKQIKRLAELDLVTTAPGSLRLGIKKPSLDYFLELDDSSQTRIDEAEQKERMLEKAVQESSVSLSGLKLLLKAITATNDPGMLKSLTAEINDPKGVLKLLFYARDLAPSQSSKIDTITFTGKLVEDIGISETVATKETRNRIRETSRRIITTEQYIDGIGTVREVDLDKMSFRLMNLSFEDRTYSNVECIISQNAYGEADLQEIAGREIRIAGILTYSDTGEVKSLEVDTIERHPSTALGDSDDI